MDAVKKEILQNCLKYFLQHGVRKMTNDKLATLLGISTKTVYKYFENKEQLLEEALMLYHTQQYELFKSFQDKNAVCFLFNVWYNGLVIECKVNKAFFHDLNYYYPELEKRVESIIIRKVWKRFTEVIEDGIQEGLFRDDIDANIVLEAISVFYNSIARTADFKKFKPTLSHIFLNTITVIIRGFCTTAGIKELDNHIAEGTKSWKI